MSEKSEGGWLSTVSRLFSSSATGNRDKIPSNNVNVETNDNGSVEHSFVNSNSALANGSLLSSPGITVPGRTLRYLSPSNDKRSGIITTLTTTAEQNRKRTFVEVDAKDSAAPVSPLSISTQAAKRFRGPSLMNHSLIEEPVKVNVADRFDTTWSGATSFMHPSPSSSVRSLRSRISGAVSTTSSGLSSRTRAILEQLEKVSTPAKEARKLPMMRGASTASEKWQSLSTASPKTPGPPKKSLVSIPTRIQLLATFSGNRNRKPYWRDVMRKPVQEVSTTTPAVRKPLVDAGTSMASASQVHPLFDIPAELKSSQVDKQQEDGGMLKGVNGKNMNTKINKFSAADIDSDDTTLPLPEPMKMPVIEAPEPMFLGSDLFSFSPPKNRGPSAVPITTVTIDESDEEESGDESSESSDSGSEESASETESEKKEEGQDSRPPTSTDSESTALVTPVSSKNVSPMNGQKEAEAASSTSWECPGCWVSNTGDKCVCCGSNKEMEAVNSNAGIPQKTLVSNLDSFASNTKSTAQFGFSSTASVPPTVKETSKPADVKTERADWSCPDCFVDNKAVNDKCQCCGYTKYTSASSGSSNNVFGDRAFKPTDSGNTLFGLSSTTSTTKPMFGFSAQSSNKDIETKSTPAATVTTTTLPFTFGVSKPLVESVAVPASSAAPVVSSTTPGISFGLPVQSTATSTSSTLTVSNSTEKSESTPKPFSLFGSSGTAAGPTEGLKLGSLAPVSTAPLFGATTSTSTTSLFGATTSTSTAPLFGATTSLSTAPLFGANLSTAAVASSSAPSVVAPTSSLFGSSSSTIIPSGGSSIFGSTSTAPTTSSATQPAFSLSKPLLGSSVPEKVESDSKPALFGASSSSNAQPAAPLFGSATSSSSSFGGFNFSATTTAPSTSTATLSFGGSTAASQADAPAAKKPFAPIGSLFGNGAPAFGSTESALQPATAPLFGSTPSFSGNNAMPNGSNSLSGSGSGTSLNLFGSQPSAVPIFGSSATSTTAPQSMFSVNAEPPSSFNFGTTQSFGAPAATNGASQPFVFGSAPVPAANPTGPFGQSFGAGASNVPSIPAFGSEQPGGAFAFSGGAAGAQRSTTARKIAMARRRKP